MCPLSSLIISSVIVVIISSPFQKLCSNCLSSRLNTVFEMRDRFYLPQENIMFTVESQKSWVGQVWIFRVPCNRAPISIPRRWNYYLNILAQQEPSVEKLSLDGERGILAISYLEFGIVAKHPFVVATICRLKNMAQFFELNYLHFILSLSDTADLFRTVWGL